MRRTLGSIQTAAMAVLLAACTAHVAPTAPVPEAPVLTVSTCRDLYQDLDTRVARAGVGDAQSVRIAGYPYLRINRFLAADDIKPDAYGNAFEAWVEHLRDLDRQARRFELQNLPGEVEIDLDEDIESRLAACATLLIGSELSSTDNRALLLENAQVGDGYSVAKRVFGLYPFTSIPFNAGVKNLHESMRETFSQPLDALPIEGRLTRYRPPLDSAPMSPGSVSRLLQSSGHDTFGRPDLSPTDRQRLFDTFAPVYEIDVVSNDDRIGTPVWAGDEIPSVDVERPVVYRRISHTLFEGQTLLQLNYSVWFPARPPEGDLDLLSGRLDGITFRVTLGRDGRPLIYDSMHNCGCYHLFVPTTRLGQKPPSGAYEELPLVPQRIGPGDGRVVLRIAHRTHYLQRVYLDGSVESGKVYAMNDDDSLRSLPATDGHRRSLFEPDGLVHGTERSERWFFWPMGIAEPGAMRQWGHHATLFVGKRHFDDTNLIERYFRSAGGS